MHSYILSRPHVPLAKKISRAHGVRLKQSEMCGVLVRCMECHFPPPIPLAALNRVDNSFSLMPHVAAWSAAHNSVAKLLIFRCIWV